MNVFMNFYLWNVTVHDTYIYSERIENFYVNCLGGVYKHIHNNADAALFIVPVLLQFSVLFYFCCCCNTHDYYNNSKT